MGDREPIPGSRRGLSLGERFRAPDSYGLLLLLILATLIVIAAGGDWAVGRLLSLVVLMGTLLFAFRTSRVGPTALRAGMVLLAVGTFVGAVSFAIDDVDIHRAVAGTIAAVLTLSALAAVARRLASHPVVSWQTILGALSAYLLIGLVFAAVFAALDGVGRVFSVADASTVDYLYFSFVTLTTVGYGDLTASGDLPRMLAVTEALIGQLYLVSVVALVVGNLGRERRHRDG